MFKAFTDTLEVSTSYWNYIDEMYSDIRQGEQETTDQLDQHIKISVQRCGYTSPEEKMQCQLELLFHATKHFKVKKWVRSQTALNKTVTFNKLLQHAPSIGHAIGPRQLTLKPHIFLHMSSTSTPISFKPSQQGFILQDDQNKG